MEKSMHPSYVYTKKYFFMDFGSSHTAITPDSRPAEFVF